MVFAGSIFTHIDDNDTTWLQELARITKPGGLLYLTFIDEKSIETLADEPGRFVYNKVSNHPDAPQIWEGSFEKVAIYNTKDAKRVGSPLVLSHSTYIKSMCPEELEIDESKESASDLLKSHVSEWKKVRKMWRVAAFDNESRFKDSMKILEDMFET